MRFNPERVSQQSLGSTRSGAPQVRDVRSLRTLKGFHKTAIDRSSCCGTPLGFNRIFLCFSWGAPRSRRPQALLCNPCRGWKTGVDGVAQQLLLRTPGRQDSLRRSSSYSYSAFAVLVLARTLPALSSFCGIITLFSSTSTSTVSLSTSTIFRRNGQRCETFFEFSRAAGDGNGWPVGPKSHGPKSHGPKSHGLQSHGLQSHGLQSQLRALYRNPDLKSLVTELRANNSPDIRYSTAIHFSALKFFCQILLLEVVTTAERPNGESRMLMCFSRIKFVLFIATRDHIGQQVQNLFTRQFIQHALRHNTHTAQLPLFNIVHQNHNRLVR